MKRRDHCLTPVQNSNMNSFDVIEDDSISIYEILIALIQDSIISINIQRITMGTVFLIIAIMSSLLYRFRKRDHIIQSTTENGTKYSKKEIDIDAVIRSKILLNHRNIHAELYAVASKCYNVHCAIRCIELVNYCPHLMNVKREFTGFTPFHCACYYGHTCLVEYMLSKGANPGLKTKDGKNAICIAFYHFINNPSKKDFSCLDVLYQAGCNFDFDNGWYHYFLKIVRQTHNKRLMNWLLIYGQTPKVKNTETY
ncbi:uncharacterized protein LOC112495181 isoform X2 [Cephus cinctus]|uniref:Uncharacterized protein LOC112495181 isoform X2 n=1 Tax=Cephus cinctus TaxID=211228 RepID=A0AAJ7W6K4_CEPCN|nr:uncharacterized protein LOC112495181 isoform X2 [Cephus cinctus]